MRRILIFTSIERAFYSSVIEYQLLDPIIEVKKKSKNKFIYIGFIPITFWFSRQEPWKSFILYKQNRKKIRKKLTNQNIICKFVPLIFPFRHKDFYLRIPLLMLYLLNAFPLLLYFIFRYKISFIYARNYPATLLCFLIKSILGIPFTFDMRDLYPEKGIEAGVFGSLGHSISYSNWSYRLWKFIELKLIHSSLYVITTSIPFCNYIKAKVPKIQESKVKLIPNCVNTRKFKPDNKKREEMRSLYGIKDKLVLLHSGAFGTAQDISVIGKYFLKWKKLIKNSHLVILCGTKKYLPYIQKTLEKIGLSRKDYTLINPTFEEVPYLLLLGDIGLHLETMAITTPYCIAVKDGEYLASGLPIIATPWLKGIAPFIKKYEAGIVIDPRETDTRFEQKLIKEYKKMRENGFKLVKEELSFEICVLRLSSIFNKLDKYTRLSLQ
jgi:glycosyltransferase involved in cell wall biosynthesis